MIFSNENALLKYNNAKNKFTKDNVMNTFIKNNSNYFSLLRFVSYFCFHLMIFHIYRTQ